jgi:hypothetical protein
MPWSGMFHVWNAETSALSQAVKDDSLDVTMTMVGLE